MNIIWKHFAGTAQTKPTCGSSLRKRWGASKNKKIIFDLNFFKDLSYKFLKRKTEAGNTVLIIKHF